MRPEVAAYRHPADLPDQARALFARAEADGIALGPSWYGNLQQSVWPGSDAVRYYVLSLDGRTVAVLPVLIGRGALPRHQAVDALSNYYTALYAPVLAADIDAAALAPLLAEIRRRHAPLGRLRLQPMDPQAGTYRIVLQALRLAGLRPYEFYCFGNWFQRGHADWQDYLAQRTSKLRSNIKRMDKKLAQDGATVEILADADQVERAVAAYQRVYAASWKQDEPHAAFVPGLISTCAARGWLRLGVVWLGDRPIAAQLWIVAAGKAEIYKVAYDEAYKDYSPGTVLTARLMQHVIEQDRVTEIDYLIGDDPYKKLWMNERRERWGIVAYNPRTVDGALGLAREALGRAAKPALQRLRAWRDARKAAAGGPAPAGGAAPATEDSRRP